MRSSQLAPSSQGVCVRYVGTAGGRTVCGGCECIVLGRDLCTCWCLRTRHHNNNGHHGNNSNVNNKNHDYNSNSYGNDDNSNSYDIDHHHQHGLTTTLCRFERQMRQQ
jgi:hypothetical protein